MAYSFSDSISIIVVTFIDQPEQLVSTWISEAVQMVPINVLTNENKMSMIQTVSDPSEFRNSQLSYELDLLAKRARSSAIRN